MNYIPTPLPIEDPQQITAKLSKRLEIVRELSDKVETSLRQEYSNLIQER